MYTKPGQTDIELADDLFTGPGELRALCRAFDWSKTPLGPPVQWSHSLRTTVATLLASHHPMFLFWGPELIQFYNDAYRPSLANGGRHPRALGARGEEFWTDIWDIIGPQIEAVMTRAEATWHVDQLVAIERNGRMEEVYWTYSYSPVLDDDGSIGGNLVICQETTATVITMRRVSTLHQVATLGRQTSAAATVEAAGQLLAANDRDVPFLLCYLADNDGYELACSIGVPAEIGLNDNVRNAVERVMRSRAGSSVAQLVDVSAEPSLAQVGPWPEPPRFAAVIPLEHPASATVYGALVLGVSSRLSWDATYVQFAETAAHDIALQLAGLRDQAENARLTRALEMERARLEHTFRRAPTYLAVLRGPNHVYELANDAYLELLGNRDIIGKPLIEAVPEIKGQGFVEMLTSVIETGEPFIGRDVAARIVRRPGGEPETVYIDLTYMPYVEPDGTRSGVIAHGVETTEQVHARAERERLLKESEQARQMAEAAKREAEAANRAKSDFLAIMSHELRTPLNAIGGYAELMEMGVRGPITENQRTDLARIQASQRHLLGLINEVLSYAKVETGSIPLNLERVPVRSALTDADTLVQPQMNAKGIHLTVGECDDFGVQADVEKLRQILVNLLSNALKFTDRGGSVELGCSRHGDRIHITVRDSGIGIPADQLQAIFEPFVQVQSTLTRHFEGTGLGLAISRDLARAMGGDLYAESTLGRGSTFTLVLNPA